MKPERAISYNQIGLSVEGFIRLTETVKVWIVSQLTFVSWREYNELVSTQAVKLKASEQEMDNVDLANHLEAKGIDNP